MSTARPMIEPSLRELRDFDRIGAAFRWRLPSRYNIGVAVCDRHAGDPDRVALHAETESGARVTYTFAQLKRLSDRLANALSAQGIGPGDFVASMLGQRAEAALLHLAVFKLGAVSLPLSPLFGPDAVEYRLADSGAKALLFRSQESERTMALAGRLPELRVLIDADGVTTGAHAFEALTAGGAESFTPHPTAGTDPALLVYTSGTTGLPKGALHAHQSIPARLTGLEMAHNLFPQPDDLFWTPADWAWVGGLFDSLLAPWSHGMPVVAIERSRFDPERALTQMAGYGIRNAFLPPTALKLLRQVPRIGERFALRMRSVHCGGESLSPDVLSWGAETFGSVAEIYGMTEVGFVVGNCPELLPIRPGSMGKAYPGHRVAIVDEAGREQPPGTVGEVAVHRSDPGMFLGYWHDEAGTRAKQAGEWFLSGDLAERDAAGHLWYRARKDDVIISAGYRFGPTEIENAILKHTAVRDVAVVASPDPMRGQIAKAFVVLAEGEAPSEARAEEIRTLVKSRLGAHEFPREIEFVSELPRTSTGKVARAELRRREQERKPAG